jgi:hypothetical protein
VHSDHLILDSWELGLLGESVPIMDQVRYSSNYISSLEFLLSQTVGRVQTDDIYYQIIYFENEHILVVTKCIRRERWQ